MNKYLKILILSLAPVAMLSLAGCGLDAPQAGDIIVKPAPPKSPEQKQKLYGYLLGERGISVLQVGETRTIVISSDYLFTAGSANFNPDYVKYLKIVGQLVNSYDTTSVAVTAYSSAPGAAEQALTEKQAQKVLQYLEKCGVSTRLIYAKGYGDAYPVAINRGSQFNRRVEIKFQFNPEEKVY
jgi:outer membrane protein OmpA-like peptidoglycan-associated protein